MAPPRLLLSPFRSQGSGSLSNRTPSDGADCPVSPLADGVRSASGVTPPSSNGDADPDAASERASPRLLTNAVRRLASPRERRGKVDNCEETHPAWASPLETGRHGPAARGLMLEEVSSLLTHRVPSQDSWSGVCCYSLHYHFALLAVIKAFLQRCLAMQVRSRSRQKGGARCVGKHCRHSHTP